MDTITRWWKRWPYANIAVATGPAGLVVLDVDPAHGGRHTLNELLKRHGAELYDRLRVKTGGGGDHLIFVYPPGVTIRGSAGKLGPGIDVRAAGGYIVAPPSLHRSGRCYEFVRGTEGGPAVIPAALLRLLAGTGGRQGQPAGVEVFQKGQRNVSLASLGGSMRRRGMTTGAVLAALLVENQERCDPPLEDAEVERIVHSIARYHPCDQSARPSPTRRHLRVRRV